MDKFEIGDLVGVRCDVTNGPFPDEMLMTVETVSGPISGFVPRDALVRLEGQTATVRGIVKAISEDAVTVRIEGSFFTTNGLADLNYELLEAA